MALIICPECGKEISDKAGACPNCGCPIGISNTVEITPSVESQSQNSKKRSKKFLPLTISLLVLAVVGVVIFFLLVVIPKKTEEKNKATYGEAIGLLEKGKYEEGKELLQTIPEYKDVATILEQIKWETYVYDCVDDFKPYLKNPDSFVLYEVAFYQDDGTHGMYGSFADTDLTYPAIVFRSGAQNGFGGNTTGYELFYYIKDEGYSYLGACDYLDEEEYYDDDGELKDDDDALEVLLCMEINEIIANAESVGVVDMARIKTVLKNDAYSAIKIIE